MAARRSDEAGPSRRTFVGREEEKASFKAALLAPDLPFLVLGLHGPGGVGKTALLREFEAICRPRGVRCHSLNARSIQPTPAAFLAALVAATGHETPEAAVAALAQGGRGVLIVDTLEAIEPLEGWLREAFLPMLPPHVLVVLSGRKRPSSAWRTDEARQGLFRPLPLRNLAEADARTYLESLSVPSDAHAGAIELTHGHPLALSLVAENYAQGGMIALGQEPPPDVVALLLERFRESVESPLQREALEVVALVRATTESLLANVLGREHAPELFEWLRSLSFIETYAEGLVPHDLARDALALELRWRNPDRYSGLHHRLRAYYYDRLSRTTGHKVEEVLFDAIFLHRDSPLVRPFFRWHPEIGAFIDGARPEDLPEILRMVERHEGPESAALARYWFERQPGSFLVLRDSSLRGPLHGLLARVALDAAPAESGTDPAMDAARVYLEKANPLQEGERALHFRFWMADEGYQSVGPAQSLLFVAIVRHYFSEPRLAATFIPCADPDFWAPIFDYAATPRLPETDFEVGGRRFGVYGCDWHRNPLPKWLDLLAEREVPLKETLPDEAPEAVVLSREEFESCVHDALRTFSNPVRLAQSPLVRSRFVEDRAEGDAEPRARARALQSALHEAADALAGNPKDARLYRALEAAYLRPQRSQEQAAEMVDVSIATFRRHLKEGVARVTELLWAEETGG